MEEVKIVYVPINDLKKSPYNPREITRHDFEALKKSLAEYGFVDPVIANKDKTVIGGHMRIEAAKVLGIEMVPVVFVDLTEEKAKILNLALNRISGDWDKEKLMELLEELNSLEVDLSLTGFNEEELSTYLDFTKEDNYQPPADLPTRSKYGEVWQLGNHRLMCGDATKKEDVEKLMSGEKAQILFTDPPYNVDYQSPVRKYVHSKIFNDNMSNEQYFEFLSAALKNAFEFTKENMSVYMFFACSNYIVSREAFENAGFYYSQMIIWVKEHLVFTPGNDYHRVYEPIMYGWKKGRDHWTNKSFSNATDVINLGKEDFLEQHDVWYEKRDKLEDYVHPTQKPVRLAERAIKKSTKPGDSVLDLFGESGSTLIACEQMERKCFISELDPYYCDIILQRWEKFTGKEAKRL